MLFSVSSLTASECSKKEVAITTRRVSYTTTTLTSSCPSLRHVTFKATQGQTLNVTWWAFGGSAAANVASVTDKVSGNIAHLQTHARRSHAMTSVGNEVEVNLGSSIVNSDAVYMIELEGV